jgi:hypothetical protein
LLLLIAWAAYACTKDACASALAAFVGSSVYAFSA